MATTLRSHTRCDLCGHTGLYSDPADFTRHGTSLHPVDLCWQCARPGAVGAKLSSGRHEVTLGTDSWTCTCGETFVDTGRLVVEGWPYLLSANLREAVPDLVAAIARHHIQRP